jgi:hypothetical protein
MFKKMTSVQLFVKKYLLILRNSFLKLNNKLGKLAVIFYLLISFGLFRLYLFASQEYKEYRIRQIDTFEECKKAGYPVYEKYPLLCELPDGRSFQGPRNPEQDKSLKGRI